MHWHLWSHAWVPASVVASPQLEVSGGQQRIEDMFPIVHIEGVGEIVGLAVYVGPQGYCLALNLLDYPLLLTVTEECAKEAAVEMVQDSNKEKLIKFKGSRELSGHLPNAVNELDKQR